MNRFDRSARDSSRSPRALAVLAASLLVGCVHAGETRTTLVEQPELQTMRASGDPDSYGSRTVHYLVEGIVVEDLIEAPPNEVWEALGEVLVDMSLAPNLIDPETSRMGVSQLEYTRALGGRPLGLFLDCGVTESQRPLADESRVVLTIVTGITPQGESATRIQTELAAAAVPLGSGREGARTCSTRGVLEREIQAAVRELTVPEEVIAQGSSRLSPGPRPVGPPGVRATTTPVPGGRFGNALELGQDVRVTVGDFEPMEGTVQSVNDREMVILWWARSVPIELSSIRRLEIRRERSSYGWYGAVVGGLAGTAAGMFSDLRMQGRTEKQGRILSPILGAIFGGLGGAYIGSRIRGDYWEEIQPAEVFPSLSSDGAGVTVRVPLGGGVRR